MNNSQIEQQPIFNKVLLEYICCPKCKDLLILLSENPISNGVLNCLGCKSDYEIVRGVPILLSTLNEKEKFTAKNFAEQWKLFNNIGGLGLEFEEKQFYEYFYPFDTKNLSGKTVLEAGCGYGRNMGQALKCGAKVVIGFDIGESAFIAKEKGYDVIIGDILNPPFLKKFDLVFSFGVLHHVSNPEKGFQKLYEITKDECGIQCHSVYSAENNWFLNKLFTPVRINCLRYLSSNTKNIISKILALPSFILFFILYKPFSLNSKTNSWASRNLFYYDYMILTVNKLGLKQWIGQIYDHMNAPIAAYISKNQIEKWMKTLDLKETYSYFRNKNTWNFGGKKK